MFYDVNAEQSVTYVRFYTHILDEGRNLLQKRRVVTGVGRT
jgi:hypothetical protein